MFRSRFVTNVQTLTSTDAQAPFLGIPLVPLTILSIIPGASGRSKAAKLQGTPSSSAVSFTIASNDNLLQQFPLTNGLPAEPSESRASDQRRRSPCTGFTLSFQQPTFQQFTTYVSFQRFNHSYCVFETCSYLIVSSEVLKRRSLK